MTETETALLTPCEANSTRAIRIDCADNAQRLPIIISDPMSIEAEDDKEKNFGSLGDEERGIEN